MNILFVRLISIFLFIICSNTIFAQSDLINDAGYIAIQKIQADSLRTERLIVYLGKSIAEKSATANQISKYLFHTARKNGDSLMVGKLYISSGFAYLSLGQLDQAYFQYSTAVPLIEKYGKLDLLIKIYEDISWIQIQLNDYKRAESSLSSALALSNGYRANDRLGEIYDHYGVLSYTQRKFDQAIAYYRTALQYNKKYGTKLSQVNDLNNIAISQQKLNFFPEALITLLQAKTLSDSLNNNYFKQAILQNISEVAYNSRDYKTAQMYIIQAMETAKTNRDIVLQPGLIRLLKKINGKIGDYKTALMYADSLETIYERIYAKERIDAASEMEIKYQSALKDDKLAQQALLASQQRQEITAKQLQLELNIKENEIKRMALLHKQSQLQNENIQQAALNEKKELRFQINSQINSKKIAFQQKIISSGETLKGLLTMILCFIVLVTIILFYNYKKGKKLNGIISSQKTDLEITGHVKDLLFSAVSHDMRAPINTLIAFTQLLEFGDVTTHSMQLYACELKKSLGHTSVLMENLLNWSLSQMQGFRPDFQLFDVSITVNEVVAILTEQAMPKGIAIQNAIPVGTLIMADTNMLQLVIRNLVSNAIKFTNEKGLVIINAENNGANVTISVRDDGIGMPEKNVNEFNAENYVRFSDSTPGTNKEKGTGLGLMLCKKFTALMNGKLQVQSKIDHGSLFLLNLPNTP
ncbi:ATP-binding protein [Mucilaginibacter sp.]|uniref:ATP-binding protein n=1 Tax=Mucilaginibacter sp. TaxID=1882438 RepID=UPI00262A78E8|nr:ATP-binding protein [Mucilaginibacter sp.]MDB5031381.1 hypothetical protein [Mucilaginibacter sp.]